MQCTVYASMDNSDSLVSISSQEESVDIDNIDDESEQEEPSCTLQ
jgi:hypothetical protein